MDTARIAELLSPYSGGAQLSSLMLQQLQLYLDLLLTWNARVNLTAVRDSEQIVARHFGESLFAARLLFPEPSHTKSHTLSDVGSGAGFPGIPIKLWAPSIQLTLIESQNKKATFLREAVRTLQLDQVEVFSGRAQDWKHTAHTITLRAVEKFGRILPLAASLVRPGGRLCLLIGSSQLAPAQQLLGTTWRWDESHSVPQSVQRIVAIAYPAERP